MISFNVKGLFTNLPLNETIDIILRKVYDENKIVINIPRSVLKELLYLCTKHVYSNLMVKFSFSAMESQRIHLLGHYLRKPL